MTATFSNKILIKQHRVPAEVLNGMHLIIGSFFDMLLLSGFRPFSLLQMGKFHRLPIRTLVWLVPLSSLALASKLLTYWSYDRVPLSLAHTAKASTPLFNVLLSYIFYAKTFRPQVYLSLLPIVTGVTIASVSEFRLNNLAFVGVMCAVTAALLSVMQSMYSKYLLNHKIFPDSINLHFYSNVMGICLNVPWIVYKYIGMSESVTTTFPYHILVVANSCNFCGSLAAFLLLGKTTELTFSIFSTLKRVVIIFGAVAYFGNQLSLNSFLGTSLAMTGIAYYQYAKTQGHDKGDHLPLHTS